MDVLRLRDVVIEGDNLAVIREMPDAAFQLIYLDPPFNTGRTQTRRTSTSTRVTDAGRVGFKGARYEQVVEKVTSYDDRFADYWEFLEPRLEEAWRLLAEDGTLYLHLDYREVHYAKVLLDALCAPAGFGGRALVVSSVIGRLALVVGGLCHVELTTIGTSGHPALTVNERWQNNEHSPYRCPHLGRRRPGRWRLP